MPNKFECVTFLLRGLTLKTVHIVTNTSRFLSGEDFEKSKVKEIDRLNLFVEHHCEDKKSFNLVLFTHDTHIYIRFSETLCSQRKTKQKGLYLKHALLSETAIIVK